MTEVLVYYRDYGGLSLCLVARVIVPDGRGPLEHAFRATQNIAGSWSRGPFYEDGTVNPDYEEGIRVAAPLPVHGGVVYGHRSSMVGDVFIMDGVTYEVGVVGFKELKP